jgi:hypothetical protein
MSQLAGLLSNAVCLQATRYHLDGQSLDPEISSRAPGLHRGLKLNGRIEPFFSDFCASKTFPGDLCKLFPPAPLASPVFRTSLSNMPSRSKTSPELSCGSRSCETDEAHHQVGREISDLRCALEGALKVQEDISEKGQHKIRLWQNITA